MVLFTTFVPRIRETPRFVSFLDFLLTYGHAEIHYFFAF